MHKFTKTERGYDIYLTRGDTLLVGFTLKHKDGSAYVAQEGDKIRFALKHKYTDPDTAAKIIKNIPTDTLVLELEPDDTKRMPMNKQYVYDVEITFADERVDTFLEGIFFIGNEVL